MKRYIVLQQPKGDGESGDKWNMSEGHSAADAAAKILGVGGRVNEMALVHEVIQPPTAVRAKTRFEADEEDAT
jgi:hypothetical protein